MDLNEVLYERGREREGERGREREGEREGGRERERKKERDPLIKRSGSERWREEESGRKEKYLYLHT